ncbi:MAG: YqeG family HAD IIIA-type phosphatase [Thermovenabulum sp.]|uniref:YqeG family HAD IIIA-type phosphatase n=2 Tax=Thermovenabulum sp. TaxID=3100335 RepID=UPI003C7B5BFE
MINFLMPDIFIKDIYELDFEILKEKNIKGILIDLDNTLLPWNSSNIDEKLTQWLLNAKQMGFKFCIISNNRASRIKECAKKLGIPAVEGIAFKPAKGVFIKGMKILGTSREETAVIGDQLFTDILGAKRMGLFAILVRPLAEKELFFTKFMRRLESRVLERFYRKKEK